RGLGREVLGQFVERGRGYRRERRCGRIKNAFFSQRESQTLSTAYKRALRWPERSFDHQPPTAQFGQRGVWVTSPQMRQHLASHRGSAEHAEKLVLSDPGQEILVSMLRINSYRLGTSGRPRLVECLGPRTAARELIGRIPRSGRRRGATERASPRLSRAPMQCGMLIALVPGHVDPS